MNHRPLEDPCSLPPRKIHGLRTQPVGDLPHMGIHRPSPKPTHCTPGGPRSGTPASFWDFTSPTNKDVLSTYSAPEREPAVCWQPNRELLPVTISRAHSHTITRPVHAPSNGPTLLILTFLCENSNGGRRITNS